MWGENGDDSGPTPDNSGRYEQVYFSQAKWHNPGFYW